MEDEPVPIKLIRLHANGAIDIPKEARTLLGLKTGDRLSVLADRKHDQLILRKVDVEIE